MQVANAREAGPAVVRQTFGAPLSQQGRGYYVTLELLAICWGTQHGSLKKVLPTLAPGQALLFRQRSHDFARRWMRGQFLSEADRTRVVGEDAEETLRTLLESLRVPIPHIRRLPDWGYQHLYPYIGELIHYDALQRRGRVSMEMNTYRGGGALVHKMLRTDPEPERLERNRAGLRALVTEEGGPLGRLARALSTHDEVRPESERQDRNEAEAIVHESSRWVGLLRDGVANITSRPETPRSKQVELLMSWVPYCVARHQMDRAAAALDRESPYVAVAIDPDSSALRQAGRRQLDSARAAVHEALMKVAADLAAADEPWAQHFEALADGGGWSEAPQQFLTGTLATVGALNANTGRRHFVASLELIEALVHAALKPNQEVPYESFCESILFGKLGIVVDPVSGAQVLLTDDIDHGELRRNSEFLASELKSLGLL
jgi:hypothetical protein